MKAEAFFWVLEDRQFDTLNILGSSGALFVNQPGRLFQVPRVFINGVCIGGGNETRQLHKRGLLLPLLESCPI